MRKLLYPAVFLSAFPLYALLVFVLRVPLAFSVILTVTSLTFLLTILEVWGGIFSRNREVKRRWALDAYYIVMGITVSTTLAEVYVLIGTWIGGSLGFIQRLHDGSRLLECLAATVLMDFVAAFVVGSWILPASGIHAIAVIGFFAVSGVLSGLSHTRYDIKPPGLIRVESSAPQPPSPAAQHELRSVFSALGPIVRHVPVIQSLAESDS